MDKFVTSIKKKYRDRLTYKEDRWPPCHSSKLIRLELVEKKEKVDPNEDQPLLLEEREDIIKDVVTKRTPLAYHDVFKVGAGKKSVRKVLVEGGAGIGKTTLCIAISEDWANGKLFEQFRLLLLLPLRHPKISKVRSLFELLKLLHSSRSVCESVVNYLEEEEGENVLIVADGWDELEKSQQHAESFLYELLLMELPFASVLITSRPSASDPLRKYMDRFIDVLGFDKENIEKFILAEFDDNLQKATGLSKQLESNPLLESVCSVPLNCAIVCHLWRKLGEVLPTTMTELYRKIILNFIIRNIRKTDTYCDIKLLTDFDSLPDDLQQSWWQLCEFSFQALIKSQIIFSQEDLGEFFSREVPVDERLLFFGLLQPIETILETGCGVSYHFLHLTFQEYLAALHLVKCPLDKLSDNNLLYQALSGNFTMVWRFYFGSYFHESKKHKPDIKLVKKHISGIKSFIKHNDLLFWHCALEAKSKDVVDLALNFTYNDDAIDDIFRKDYNVVDFGESSNAYDCEAILHGISNIEHCNTAIRFGNSSVREKQIETLGEILADKEKKIQIMGLDLSGNKLTDKSICKLFKQSTPFQSLEGLNLSENKIGGESIKAIVTSLKELPFNTLSEIDLSQNPLGVSGVKALEDGIRCDTLVQLTELGIEGSLTGVNCETRASLIVAVGLHCPNIEEIDLSPDADDSFILGLSTESDAQLASKKYNGILTELELTGGCLSDKFVCELFLRSSTAFQSLEILSVSNNKIGVETIEALSSILQRLPYNQLETLDLSDNPLGVSGIKALENAICYDTLKQLTGLGIDRSFTGVSYEHIASLFVAIAIHCPNIGDIDDLPVIPGVPDHARFVSEKKDGVLTLLSLVDWHLSDTFVCKLLLRSSITFQSLNTLGLSGNKIGVETIKAISSILQRLPYNQLEILDLSNNPLGVPGIKALEDAICCDTLVQLTGLGVHGSLTGVGYEHMASLCVAIAIHCPNYDTEDINDLSGISGAPVHALFISKKIDGMLTELSLIDCNLSDTFVRELLLRSSTAFQSLNTLSLSGNKVGVETIKALSSILQRRPSNALEILDLSDNPLGVPGLQALEDTVCCDLLTNLQQLNLQNSLKLTSDPDINGALLTTFTKALSEHSPMLKSLDLSQNNLNIVPGASTISRGSIYIKQGVLNLNNTTFGDAGLNILVENFNDECHIHTVNLMHNNIHGSGVSLLVGNLRQCRDIDFSDNPLGLEGVLAIGRFISDSCQLNRLVLSNCQLTLSGDNPTSTLYGEKIRDTTHQQFCQMAPNSTLTTVELQSNDFSEERIYILAGIMYLCPNLEHLNSYHCQINSNDFKLLLQQLIELKASSPKVCSKLVQWDLSDNKIDDDDGGVSMLIIIDQLASLFSHLGCHIKLYNNPISSAIILMRLREERQEMFEIEERKTSSMVL
jgi:Ran GTPase-activating protein (RanGAP) involved in mRNA processing and transport